MGVHTQCKGVHPPTMEIQKNSRNMNEGCIGSYMCELLPMYGRPLKMYNYTRHAMRRTTQSYAM